MRLFGELNDKIKSLKVFGLSVNALIKASIFKKDLAKLEKAIKKEDSKFLYDLFSKTRLIRKKINK